MVVVAAVVVVVDVLGRGGQSGQWVTLPFKCSAMLVQCNAGAVQCCCGCVAKGSKQQASESAHRLEALCLCLQGCLLRLVPLLVGSGPLCAAAQAAAGAGVWKLSGQHRRCFVVVGTANCSAVASICCRNVILDVFIFYSPLAVLARIKQGQYACTPLPLSFLPLQQLCGRQPAVWCLLPPTPAGW